MGGFLSNFAPKIENVTVFCLGSSISRGTATGQHVSRLRCPVRFIHGRFSANRHAVLSYPTFPVKTFSLLRLSILASRSREYSRHAPNLHLDNRVQARSENLEF